MSCGCDGRALAILTDAAHRFCPDQPVLMLRLEGTAARLYAQQADAGNLPQASICLEYPPLAREIGLLQLCTQRGPIAELHGRAKLPNE